MGPVCILAALLLFSEPGTPCRVSLLSHINNELGVKEERVSQFESSTSKYRSYTNRISNRHRACACTRDTIEKSRAGSPCTVVGSPFRCVVDDGHGRYHRQKFVAGELYLVLEFF